MMSTEEERSISIDNRPVCLEAERNARNKSLHLLNMWKYSNSEEIIKRIK